MLPRARRAREGLRKVSVSLHKTVFYGSRVFVSFFGRHMMEMGPVGYKWAPMSRGSGGWHIVSQTGVERWD